MKKFLLGAAAALAVTAPGVASADSAEVGVGYGNIDFGNGADFDIWTLNGAYNHQFDSGWVLQLDGQHDRIDLGANLGDSYGAVNLGMRNESHALYGFVGLSDVFALSFINLGAGGQLYLGNATINGSVGWSSSDDADLDITDARLDGTWFLGGDNFGLTGQAGWINADAGDADVWRISLSYNIGTGSERERSQSGASFNGARNLYQDTLAAFFF